MEFKQKRKMFMDKFCSALDKIDKSKENSQHYRTMFDKMSDSQFKTYMDKKMNDPKFISFYLEIIEYKREITIESITAMAKYINVELFEYVALPHINKDSENPVITPEKVPVGFIHIKPLVQLLLKKNSVTTDISQRNAKSGQVTGHDKTSRNSDVESYSLLAINAVNSLKELLGPRADNYATKNQMMSAIARNGFCTLEELVSTPEDKVALNTLDAYFLLQGVKTNLIHGGGVLSSPRT